MGAVSAVAARRRALRSDDAGNPRFHLDACFHDVLKCLAAARGSR
jgi:hypothetical protein